MKSLSSTIVFVIFAFGGALHGAVQNASDATQQLDALQNQARQFLEGHQPQLAIPVFRQIIALDPQNVDARGNLGVLLYFQNKYPEAITQLRGALQLNPKLWRIEVLLGIAEKRTGDLAAAQTDLEQAFQNLDDPKIQKEAGLELVELDSASGDLNRASEVVAKLEDTAPQDVDILFVAYQISLQTVDKTLLSMALAAPDSAELHMMMADQFVLLGDSENAIAQYREAIRINPRLPGVHFELAVQLKGSSELALRAEAEHEFKTALSLNQFDEKAWRGLGETMAEKGDFAAAKEDYTKALALFPKDSEAKTDLATLMVKQGDAAAATSLLESAVQDDPTNSAAHYQLSALYRQAGKADEAQKEMDEFARYKAMKDKLGKVFRQIRQQGSPAAQNGEPAAR